MQYFENLILISSQTRNDRLILFVCSRAPLFEHSRHISDYTGYCYHRQCFGNANNRILVSALLADLDVNERHFV